MKRLLIITNLLFFSTSLLISPSPVLADNKEGIASNFKVGIGWEQLIYEENEPDRNLTSSATVNNWTLGFDGLKRWKHIFFGIKGILPVDLDNNQEEWAISGIINQTNSLEYGWTRIDPYLGYPINPFINPYIGLRWSEAKQERSDFIVSGIPVAGNVTETVRSKFIMLGIRGKFNLDPQWKIAYDIEYFSPIQLKVTNSQLPGWEATDKSGYTYEFKGEVEYFCTKTLSFAFQFYGGRMKWSGSDWQMYVGRLVKWPENDTRYLGGMLNICWVF